MALRLTVQAVEAFRAAASDDELADFLAAPASTGSTDWDCLLATAIRLAATERGIEPQTWTHREPLDHEWWPGYDSADIDDGPWAQRIRSESIQLFRLMEIVTREKDWSTW